MNKPQAVINHNPSTPPHEFPMRKALSDYIAANPNWTPEQRSVARLAFIAGGNAAIKSALKGVPK